MSRRIRNIWDVGDNRGFVVEGGGETNSIRVCIEAWLNGGEWDATIDPFYDITSIYVRYATSDEAMIGALEVLIRDLDATASQARKALEVLTRDKIQVVGCDRLRSTLDKWGDSIQAFPITGEKGQPK